MFQIKLHKNVSKFLEDLDPKNKAACKKAIDGLTESVKNYAKETYNAAKATTELESIPPLIKAPIGTSETI